MGSMDDGTIKSDGLKKSNGRRFSLTEKILVVALVGIIVICIAFVAIYAWNIQGDRLHRSTGGRNKGDTISYKHYQNKTFGSDDATVEVIAVLPFEIHCHNPTIEHLYEVVESNPSDFRVKFYELHSPEGLYQLQQNELVHCAAVIIDGSAFAELPDGSDALFIGPVNDKYTIEELSQALEFKLASKKGEASED